MQILTAKGCAKRDAGSRYMLAAVLLFWVHATLAFDFGEVAARAEQLAAAPYKKPTDSLPKELEELSYDKYRDIRYKPEKFYWRSANLPLELAFLQVGFY